MRLLILILLLTSLSLMGSDAATSSNAAAAGIQKEGTSQIIGQLGYTQIDGDSYLKFNVGYEFNLGLVGVGVQLPLNILVYCDEEGGCDDKTWNGIRKADWDEFSDYFKIIRYVRYGHKFDEKNMFYGRVGALSDAYIGHSTIVNSYTNVLNWDTFKPGVQFDMYTRYGGFETITDDITNPNIIGFRGFVRPLSFVFNNALATKLAFGSTIVSDIQAPKALDTTSDELEATDTTSLTIIGVDVEYRLFQNKIITITPYIDYNMINNFGSGVHIGVDTRLHIPLTGAYFKLKPEYRILGDEYSPGYFDTVYEVSRWSKRAALKTEKSKQGYYVEVGYDQYLLDMLLFRIKGAYEDYEGDNNSRLMLYGAVPILSSFQFSALYNKSLFDDFSDAFSLEDALLAIELSYNITGPLFMGVRYLQSWFFVPGETLTDGTIVEGELDSDYSFDVGFYVAFQF